MKKLYIHIGTHKTGTTSLQKALLENKETLAQHDFFLPHLENSKNIKPSWFFDFSNFKKIDTNGGVLKSKHKIKTFFDNKTTKDGTYILSAEGFCFIFNENILSELKSILKDHFDSVKIIIYLRRQDEFAISLSQQASKGKYPETYMLGSSNLSLPSKEMSFFYDKYFNYMELCSRWANVFGKENIIIKEFNKKKLKNNNIIDDFVNLIEAPTLNFECKSRNESLGLKATKVGHLINEFSIPEFCKDEIIKKINDNRKSMPSRLEAIKFYEQYKKSNKELVKEFNLTTENEFFFDDNFEIYDTKKRDLWTENDANESIKAILSVMDKNIIKNLNPNFFIDCAIELENIDLKKSLHLMECAKSMRPNGPYINKKITEYKKKLSYKVND